jgi:DNA-directed RNA polymerase subunit H (RpoH/RPB5)
MDSTCGKFTPTLENALDTVLDILIYRGIYFGRFLKESTVTERITINKMRELAPDYIQENKESIEFADLYPVAEFEQSKEDFDTKKDDILEMKSSRHDNEFESHVLPLIEPMLNVDFFDGTYWIQPTQYKKVGILLRMSDESIGKNEVLGIVNAAKKQEWTHCILISKADMTPMAKRDLTMQLYKFPCEFFHLPEVQKNPLRHALVPWYRICGPMCVDFFLEKYKCTINEFPKMIENDKITRLLNLPKGTVVFEWPHAGFMYVPWTLRTVQATEKTEDGVVIF